MLESVDDPDGALVPVSMLSCCLCFFFLMDLVVVVVSSEVEPVELSVELPDPMLVSVEVPDPTEDDSVAEPLPVLVEEPVPAANSAVEMDNVVIEARSSFFIKSSSIILGRELTLLDSVTLFESPLNMNQRLAEVFSYCLI